MSGGEGGVSKEEDDRGLKMEIVKGGSDKAAVQAGLGFVASRSGMGWK